MKQKYVASVQLITYQANLLDKVGDREDQISVFVSGIWLGA